jgi:hypothetical protein
MTALYSATLVLALTLSLVLSGCATETAHHSQSADIGSEPALTRNQQQRSTDNSAKQKDEMTKIYSQAIGDYIRLVNKEYNLTFDTLFFGKHVNGQPTDFPDIELPTAIENTNIILISPEQGEKNQKERTSSFYINLIGSVNSVDADFIFVTFSNGFAHQFDCFIAYSYDTDKKAFVVENTRFENYQYKAE